jgi:GTP-binding protein HflX
LLGYTNAGKTALLNLCAGVDLPSENKLFETLDTTQRGLHLKSTNQNCLMMDTVGFITNLPHALVASFRATLA